MSDERQRLQDHLDGDITLQKEETAWMLEGEKYLIVKEAGVYTVYGNSSVQPVEKLKTKVVDEVVDFLD
jgi:hypothetical protein